MLRLVSSSSESAVSSFARRSRQYHFPVLLITSLSLCILLVPSVAFMANVRQRQQHQHQLLTAPWCFVQQQKRSSTVLSMAVAKSGGKIILNEMQFEKNVLDTEGTQPVMVFFTAPWCGPCRLSAPVVKEVMMEYESQLLVVEVCTDDFPDIASQSGVVSIPTIQIYFRGQLLDTIVGCVARNVLASSVAKVLEETIGDKH